MNTRPKPRRSPLDGAAAARYRIGDLEVDLGRVRVVRDGQDVPLPRLSFDLLIALARVAPNLATYEELMQEVWPGVIVGPETVSQRVKLLREALGDQAREPRYVAAVRGRGYRLVPEVAPVHDAGVGSASEPAISAAAAGVPGDLPPSPPPPPAVSEGRPPAADRTLADPGEGESGLPASRRSRPAVVAVVAAAVAAIAIVAWFGSRDETAHRHDAGPSPTATSAPSATTLATVAVLPFELLGPEPVEPYVGLGIAEMVLNRLSNSRSLAVVARNSSFALDTRGLDAAQIGERLGARFLVQGGVQRAGDRLRVTVQLVDASAGRQLDAMRFDKPTSDLFALQDEIAATVAGLLDVQVAAGGPGTRVPAAQVAYLQGLELLGRWRVAESDAAVAKFVQARELDPQFAAAYAGEARARRQAALLRGENPPPRTPELIALAERALALDPRLGPAYVLRGVMRDDPVAAEADLRRGIELSPSDAAAHLALGELLSRRPGRSTEAFASLDRAVALDPLQPRARYLRALVRYVRDGGGVAFEQDLREVLEIDPDYTSALTRLGLLVAAERGALGEGLALLERSLAADPTAWFTVHTAAEMYLALGYVDRAASLVGDAPRGEALRLAIAVQRGDSATAARLALPTPDAVRAGDRPVSAVGSVGELAAVIALRDEALRSGRIEDGLRALRDHHCTPLEPPEPTGTAGDANPWGECVSPWTLPGAAALAQLEIAAGRRARGEQTARNVLAFLDSEEARRLPHPYVASSRARALAVLGRWDEALTALESARQAQAGLLGWWVISRDSVFDPVRGAPRFQAVKRAADGELARERERYQQLRLGANALSAAPPSPATAGSAARTAR